MGEGNTVSGGTILGFDSTVVKEEPQQRIGLSCVEKRSSTLLSCWFITLQRYDMAVWTEWPVMSERC
jgi:hypothetical protein